MNLSVIFDMDGVLIDSEPLWWRAGVEALRTVGVFLSDEYSHETKGMRTDEALQHWFRRFPWSGRTIDDLTKDVDRLFMTIVEQTPKPLPGVLELLELLLSHNIQLAVCSSAPHELIEVTLLSLGIRHSMSHIVSAHDEVLGKPHPAAYLRCASLLSRDPRDCIAIEDSVYGAISAKAAQMKVVAVQNNQHSTPGVFDFCNAHLSSLEEFDQTLLYRLI